MNGEGRDDGSTYALAHGGCFAALATFVILFLLAFTSVRFPPDLFAIASGAGIFFSIVGFGQKYSKTPFVLYLLLFVATLLPWLGAFH